MMLQPRKPPANTIQARSPRISARYRALPGPPGPVQRYPFSELFALRKSGLLRYLQHITRNFGPVARVQFGPAWAYLINEPELIRDILQRDHGHFTKPLISGVLQELMGYGLFTADGDLHRRQRKLMQPAFHKRCMERYVSLMSECVDTFDRYWIDGGERDIVLDMRNLTMRIVTKCLFSSTIESELDIIGNALSSIVAEVQGRVLTPLGPYRKRLPLPSNFRFQRAVGQIDASLLKIIQERREAGDALIDDLLAIMMAARDDDDGTGMSEQQLRDEAVTLFVAGHETTAVALAWAFYEVARNPELQRRLQEEADQTEMSDPTTLADVSKLSYARNLFQESLRFYPPVPLFARQVLQEYTMGDYLLPPGAIVVLSPYITQRDSRFYPHPDLFEPERWTPAFRESLPKFAFFPFGGGPRVCIGEQFAWTEGALALAEFARRWEFELLPHQDVQPLGSGTLRPPDGIKLRVRRRKPTTSPQ